MTTDREPQQLGKLVGRRVPRPASVATSKPSVVSQSRTACPLKDFLVAMGTLVALKRTADFTQTQLRAWHAVLGTFRPATINKAVLLVVASQDRFPEVSDLWQECRRIEKRQAPYSPHASASDARSLTEPEIREIAERIGLEV